MQNFTYEIIKLLCDEKGISINQLEKDLGFGSATISKWKTRNPSANKLSCIADYFNTSIDYLMGRTKTKKFFND